MATVTWTDAAASAFDDAKTNGKALVLYFEDKSKGAKWPEDVDLTDLQTKGLVACVRVPKALDPKKNPAPPSKVVGINKLAANNLWEVYGSPKDGTFIICDENGNEFFRGTDKKLQKNVVALRKQVKDRRAKADTFVKKAEKLIDAKNDDGAIKELQSALKLELNGWDESIKAAELYNALIGRGRDRITEASGDATKLKAIQKTYKGTDIDPEVEAALKAVASK